MASWRCPSRIAKQAGGYVILGELSIWKSPNEHYSHGHETKRKPGKCEEGEEQWLRQT
jgi:hypothetical protein